MKVIINARDALGTRRGGIGRYSINLLENLAGITEDGTELSVVVSREDLESDARVGALSLAGKRLRLLPRSFGSDISRIYFDHAALLGEIDRGGADIVHALKFVLPSARSIPERVRKVVTIHDLIFLERPELFTARTRNYWKCVVKRSAARADAIVVPSEHTREQVRRHYGEEAADKCEVIHHGIDPVFLDRGREMKVGRTDGVGGENGPRNGEVVPFFLCVGTVEPRKNLKNIVEAFRIFMQTRDEGREKIVWAGKTGWKMNGVLQDIHTNGLRDRIEFRGFVKDEELSILYSKAAALLYPSLDEGFGLPVLEAMARGCPVIHSGRGALRDVAGDGQVEVDPTDPASIAQGMISIYDDGDNRRKVSTDGRERAGRFTWGRSAERLLTLYRELVDDR